VSPGMGSSSLAPAPVSAATTQAAPRPSLIDSLKLGYQGFFYGPSVTKGGMDRPGIYSYEPASGANHLINLIYGGATIAENWAITYNHRWDWEIHGSESDTNLMDGFLKLKRSNIVNENGWNLAGDLRLYTPVSKGSQDKKRNFAYRFSEDINYSVPKTRWTLELFMYQRFDVWASDSPVKTVWETKGSDAEFYFAPYVWYTLMPNLKAWMMYEVGMAHMHGEDPGLLPSGDNDVNLGLSWDVTPKITFEPFLFMTVGGSVNAETTSIGFNVYVTAL
jgi:hypothetical protein